MIQKYTPAQKLEATKYFEEGFTAREIFEVLNIPIGTLYRWKSEDPKLQQSLAESKELLRLRHLVEAQAALVEAQAAQIAELEKYVAAERKAKDKRRDYEDISGFQFKPR